MGYGKKNSVLFQRMHELTAKPDFISVKDGFKVRRIAKTDISPSEGYKTTQDELDAIYKTFETYDAIYKSEDVNEDEPLTLPMFHNVPEDPETVSLMNQYQQQQRLLTDLYNRNDFLNVILEKLMSTEILDAVA